MFQHKITLPDGTVLDSSVIRSVQLTGQVNDQTDLCPGAACAACAEIELWAPENSRSITQGAEFTLARVDAESGAQTPVGVFLAEKPQKKSANVIRVTAYDRMTLLDKDLSPWLREHQGAFPMTIKALVQAVCAQCGVEIVPGNLEAQVNTGYSVPAFYTDNMTGRQVIQWAAQAMCRFARMTPAGQLEFAWYTDHARSGIGPGAGSAWTALDLSGQLLATADGEVWTFAQPQAGYFSGTLSYEDYETAPIDKVQIRQSQDDVGVIYPPGETATNALVIQGNLLLTTQTADALRPVARAIFEQMQGVTYTPLQVSIPLYAGAPAPGEIITVTDAYGRTMQAYIMQRTISGQKVTLESTGNARRDGTSAVNNQKWQNLQGKMLEIKADVDGLNIKASDLEGNFSQLQQTVDGFSLTVSKASDNDLFGDALWKGSAAGVSVDGKSVSITAPSAGNAGATLDVPAANLEKIDEETFVVSVDYRITADVNTGNDLSGIAFWLYYPDGNISAWVKLIYYSGITAPAQDWQTEKIEVTGKSHPPTRVYMYAYLSAGTGSIELRNPVMYRKAAGSSISLTSNGIVIGTASDIVQVDETRDAFAQSDHSVTINSGTITFTANTLVVDSDNFKLTKNGDVSITGDFHSGDGTNKVDIQDGLMRIWRKISSNEWREAATISAMGNNAANGMLYLLGPGDDGGQVRNVLAGSSYSGGMLTVYNAAGQGKFAVSINGNGDAEVWVNGVKRF